MELIRNIRKGEFGMVGEVYFGLFTRYIELCFDEDIPREYVEKCVSNLNSLSENTILSICEYSLNFCKDYMENFPEVEYLDGLSEISNPKEILKYIQPVSLTVDEPKNINTPAINLYCKCSWDMDNDMQILINNNVVVYVGTFDGLDPWQTNLSEWGNYVTGYKI